MKKIISIMLAVMMSVAVITSSAVPCLAVWYGSIEEADQDVVIKVTVNEVSSVNGSYTQGTVEDEHGEGDSLIIDFVYTGNEKVLYWEVKGGLVEGVDYKIVKQEDTFFQIIILNKDVTDIWANAVTTDKTEKVTGVKHPDKSHTSPKTGAGVGVMGVAFVGVGTALLATTKKRR